MLYNDVQTVFRGVAVPSRAKKINKVLVQKLFIQAHRMVWNMKKKIHQEIKKKQNSKGLHLTNTSEF